jgi:dTDP-4-amino-4,6-dideoxygalactose transaminase
LIEGEVKTNAPKSCLGDLAILGGRPAFGVKMHVGRPNVGRREDLLRRIGEMLDRRWFSNDGPFAVELERRIAGYLGVKHCVVTCNATIALEIATRALGLRDEVIIPSFTFIATAHALQWQGITPVFCDIDQGTHNIDPTCVERAITPRTTGIIGVHVWGRPCDTEAMDEIARRRGLKVIYDAAHAFACSHKGKMIGNSGNAEVFSFHATKFLTTFEGGAVVTNDDELAKKMRLMKNFGFAGYDEVIYIGTNGKMNEASAAMGLTGLESMAEFIAANQRNYKQYHREMGAIPGIKLVSYDEAEKCNYQYIVLEVDDAAAGITRDQLQKVLWAENVLARRYFFPGCHRMEPYRSRYPDAGLLLPETERLARRVLCLPTGTSVTVGDVEAVCGIIKTVVEHSSEVHVRLSSQESR